MSFIVNRTYGSESDTKLVLQNSNIARAHGVPAAWQTLRVGIRYKFGLDASFFNTFTGTPNIFSAPIFALGFCSGTSAGGMVLDATTRHFVGIVSTGTWIWSSQVQVPQYLYNFSTLATVITGAQTRQDSNSSGTWYAAASGAEAGRSMFLVDIVKGSPNYTINAFSHIGNNAAWTDPTLADLETQMELVTPGFSHYVTVSGTVPVNEAASGVLDCVTIAWNRTPQTIEISDIIVARVA